MITAKQLKQLVKLAAKIREDSYDNKLADAIKDSDDFPHHMYHDFSQHYGINIKMASLMACTELGISTEFADPVDLLLTTAWNNILDWAAVTSE